MDFLPVFLRVSGRHCLLVGGGQVALRKAGLLLRAGARLRVVAPELQPELRALLQDSEHEKHEVLERSYATVDLDDCVLVVAATDDLELNRRVHAEAQTRGLPVNVVDNPALCSFIFPSIVDRSPVVVAVSSGGRSPVLARLLRARLETFIPASYGRLAELLGRFRGLARDKVRPMARRLRFWEDVLNGPVAELALAGREEQAEGLLRELLEGQGEAPPLRGEVWLVGAGPGDPDLLTFRALRLMQQADVVLYDRLVAPEILNMLRQDAERIHVGKQRANHSVPQEEISRMLVRLAQEGKRVLRLKGGDPFIFGRGGEEIAELSAHGIPFQVVPGITAASGCAAYAGIPLTHRDYAQSVRFVTGHLKEGGAELDWRSLVQPHETVVFYMGLAGLPEICRQLIAHGRAAATPAALVQQGTTPQQRVLTGSLATLPGIVAANEVKAPTLLIVGEVVQLHATLAWKGEARA